MILYTIKFTDGSSVEEYGYNESDIRGFCYNVYRDKTVESIQAYS